MPTKLSTTLKKIVLVPNPENAELISEFHKFMMSNGASERHQNNNLKAIISFAKYLGPSVTFGNINSSQDILSFLGTKMKTMEVDPDQKCITTWTDYLRRIKHFLRWLHNKNDFPKLSNVAFLISISWPDRSVDFIFNSLFPIDCPLVCSK
jgi:hypothetical protein